MARVATQHVCSECGTASPRWLGKCPGCGAFGTLVEEIQTARPSRTAPSGARTPVPLGEVRAKESERLATEVAELDRVLGGGLVPASLVLVAGEPGVGKSTLLLTALAALSRTRKVLLVTGEESPAQVSLRAARLGG
ncbi:MAG TPA: ATPase domain-containing protein, partial [Gaiellaceae bacterium]